MRLEKESGSPGAHNFRKDRKLVILQEPWAN
jgi:hypothetical protein